MPDEQLPVMPVIVMIVGTPFSYKSSLAMTSKNPVHIDGDRGSQRAIGRCPVFAIDSWQEVKDADGNGKFAGFDTMILDTPKAIIEDFIWNYTQGIKFQSNTMKIYGEIGTEFKAFVGLQRANKKDLVMVSHEKTKEQGDKTIYEPDITGQSKQLLLRMCDQVGFMEKRERKDAKSGKNVIDTVLTFNPTPQWPFCKNVAGLPDFVLPHYTEPEWKGFLDREVIVPTKDAMAKMSDEQKAALEFISGWHIAIDAIDGEGDTTASDLLENMSGAEGIANIKEEHLKTQIRAYFMAHLKKIGYKWDKTVNEGKGGFVPAVAKPAETPPTTPPADQTPPANAPSEFPGGSPASEANGERLVVQAESNPAGLMPKPSTPSIQVPDGAKSVDPNKVDVFAPRGDHAQDAYDQMESDMDKDLFANTEE